MLLDKGPSISIVVVCASELLGLILMPSIVFNPILQEQDGYGVYFYRLVALGVSLGSNGAYSGTKKLIFVK